jgi:ABC-type spermidine/putrescine transport system permease subunit II
LSTFHAAEVVTWIKVERPTLDLVRLVLGSFTIAGLLVATALLLGTAAGIALIVRRRRETHGPTARLEL